MWEMVTVPHGPVRRLTIDGLTVAGFHLFGVDDIGDASERAVIIYFVDIWNDEFTG